MKSGLRIICITIIFIAGVVMISGCAKHATVAGPASPAPLAAAMPEDRMVIVARVNGADITRHDLIILMNRMAEINLKTSTPESPEETRKKALDQLIFQELACQEAARQGLRIEDQRIDKAMDAFIMSLGHEQGYNDFLERQQITPVEVRASIERRLLLQLIATREIVEKVVVTDDDVRKEYEQQKDQFFSPEKVIVVDVLISPKLDGPASMKKSAELLAAINADKDKNPRNLVPDDTFTVKSRDIQKEKEPALYDAALKLKQGELSGVIKTGNSVHIMQLTEYAPRKQMTFEEVKSPLTEKVKARTQIKRFQEWEQELKKDAKVELLDTPERAQKKP